MDEDHQRDTSFLASFACSQPPETTGQVQEYQQDVIPNDDYNEVSQGDYIILTSLSDVTPADETNQMPEQRVQPYNILDESVRQLFCDDPNDHNDLNDGPKSEGEESSDSFLTYTSPSGFHSRQSDSESSNKSSKVSPFSDECRIPLPGICESGVFGGRTFVRRRNERERARVRSVNEGFERLRAHLPLTNDSPKDKRLSKVDTLRSAIQYIEHLQSLLQE